MPIKFSELAPLSVIDGTVTVPIVDNSGQIPVSKKTNMSNVASYVLSGNAASATKLQTSRNINGVAFDGTANITITAAASTLTGTTLASNVVSSSLTSVGTLTNLTVTNTINGNAATATKLQTARNINGVAFDGTADISITTALAVATTNTLGGVIVGTGISVDGNGVISTNPLVPATTSILGGVIIGPGFAVDGTGEISYDTMFHGFTVNLNGDLIYSYTQDSTVSLQDATGADLYEDTDIGTSNYSYSMDSNGNLIVTFS